VGEYERLYAQIVAEGARRREEQQASKDEEMLIDIREAILRAAYGPDTVGCSTRTG
jgi:hypothetical protein